ncbi:MAG: peptide chain release factor N(5)-glutamine methyltransferase [Oscillospiraceae bacterium]|jgi:release factor glutamine methyltransferase|nr:peptide chain release factor N(5)-glutamine methyltransferase [Oscillospiraceae bacterium]
MTYADIYLEARSKLREITAAFDLEARLICAAASGKPREDLLRDLSLFAPASFAATVEELVARRLTGEPIAYILGEWEFYSLPVAVTRDTLIPRADTEVLAEAAIRAVRAREMSEPYPTSYAKRFAPRREGETRVLDLCCGTGCVGIAIAANTSCRVVLADKSAAALAVARSNVARHRLARRALCVEIDALEPPPRLIGTFDVIVCNPPYIPSREIETLDASVRDFEPRLALDGGEDGLDFFRKVAAEWRGTLRERGILSFECGAGQAPAVTDIMRRAGYVSVAAIRDTRDIDRVVAGVKL